MEIQSISVAAAAALLAAWAFCLLLAKSIRRRRNLPPGPLPLPVIGSLHLLGDKPHISISRLSAKYGPVMNLKLGTVNTVVISSPAAAKEALQKQDSYFSASRGVPDAVRAHDHHHYSVIFLPISPEWRALRKSLTSNMFSGSKLDANHKLRDRKIQDLISYCRKMSRGGEAVDIGREAFKTSLNLLSNTIFSKDLCDPDSDSAKEFKDLVWSILVETGKPNLADYFPVLGVLDPQGVRRRSSRHLAMVLRVFKDLIDERAAAQGKILVGGCGDGRHDDDVLDSLLGIGQEGEAPFSSTQIQHLFADLFIAGTDTSSNTIEWAMSELLRNPETMAKAQSELREVLGKGKMIHETDIPRLPFLQCIVKETFRLHAPSAFLIPRRVEQNLTLFGHTIPKGSQILINIWAIGRDPSVWEAPLAFKPERFLGLGMDFRGQDFELLPFGTGRRMCPGLPMAVRMVHVMLGSLLNSFRWRIEGGVLPNDLDMEEKFGVTLAKAHPLRAIPIAL
ncbi:unnamed protein product [Cuscuta campestris]|uniref:Geraniol 8-hydroxylase n=1 Tax=Cuscuta campestris TaxID=132261 RepID=A0A484K531_9ASTE|nr:unnamed protein product [Cuscuta campestris]